MRLVPNSIQGGGIRQLISPSLEGLMKLFLEVGTTANKSITATGAICDCRSG